MLSQDRFYGRTKHTPNNTAYPSDISYSLNKFDFRCHSCSLNYSHSPYLITLSRFLNSIPENLLITLSDTNLNSISLISKTILTLRIKYAAAPRPTTKTLWTAHGRDHRFFSSSQQGLCLFGFQFLLFWHRATKPLHCKKQTPANMLQSYSSIDNIND